VFPSAPNVEGLPPWLQVIVCVPFALALMIGALRTYKKAELREPAGASQAVVAAFPDMTAVRQLTDQCRVLSEHVDSLNATLRDHTHYLRNKIEVDQEVCQRLRELRDEIVRHDRQAAQRTPPGR
jgi:predicted membrane-bound mannosyltransferase